MCQLYRIPDLQFYDDESGSCLPHPYDGSNNLNSLTLILFVDYFLVFLSRFAALFITDAQTPSYLEGYKMTMKNSRMLRALPVKVRRLNDSIS
jgi:hypothetical protein